MSLRAVCVAALLVVLPVSTWAQSIQIFFDPVAFSRCASVGANSLVSWYVYAVVGGVAAGGIAGAELRLEGTPAGWPMTATPSSAADFVAGNPLQDGAQIAFPTCQGGVGEASLVLLYTIQGVATHAVPCTPLSVRSHRSPSNPAYACALLVLCDAPVWTKVCAWTAEAYINGSCGHPAGCPTSVQGATWPQVKRLYE